MGTPVPAAAGHRRVGMADLMWGGGHYTARQTMERELPGHRQSRRDMLASYESFSQQERRHKSVPREVVLERARPPRTAVQEDVRLFRRIKPGAGLGWTEPRMEKFIGQVDRRKLLPGYIGGVRLRDSVFRAETRV